MSNSYFQFKQFRVEQDRCAMKVSTDACIQGAWTPIADGVRDVLDIGAGTGLLSLMLAQRSALLRVDAIELDIDCAGQAQQNAATSPWADRIHILTGDARTYPLECKYDLVICNPPFFNNSLTGPDAARNQARHSLSFTYNDLLTCLENSLTPAGHASIMLPTAEHDTWQSLLQQHNWRITQKLEIVPRDGGSANRIVSICSKTAKQLRVDMLCIRKDDNSYTEDFIGLMQPYYLFL